MAKRINLDDDGPDGAQSDTPPVLVATRDAGEGVEPLEHSDGYYHFRLKKAAMFIDDFSGLDLNEGMGKRTGRVQRGLPQSRYRRVQIACNLGRIEQYNPNVPDMTEVTPPPKKDLTRTPEYKMLNDLRQKIEHILDFVRLAGQKGRRAVVPLKIMHYLETTGQNAVLRPRPDLVDLIESTLKTLGVTDYRITEVEENGILQLNESPEEYLVSMQ